MTDLSFAMQVEFLQQKNRKLNERQMPLDWLALAVCDPQQIRLVHYRQIKVFMMNVSKSTY